MSLRGTIAASLLLLLPPVLVACSREPPSVEAVRAPGVTFTAEVGSTRPPGWPSRVLITNDDGIAAPGLAALVRAFSATTEVVVVAPASNRSGSASYASILSGRVDVGTVAVNGARAAYAWHIRAPSALHASRHSTACPPSRFLVVWRTPYRRSPTGSSS